MQSEFSFLICGQINSRLSDKKKALRTLRKQLPDVEIVVSTWVGEVNREDYGNIDILIEQRDPGESPLGRNWKRIISSTQAAINSASRPFLIRSRIEVGISEEALFNNLLSIIWGHDSKKLFMPYGVSSYQLSKGLLFAWPDFFHIGHKNQMRLYWEGTPGMSPGDKFHMTTDAFNSLSSDQVLGYNYARQFGDIDFSLDKYKYTKKNWDTYSKVNNNNFMFFREECAGLDFGRLSRTYKKKKSYQVLICNEQWPLSLRSNLLFIIMRFWKKNVRNYFYIRDRIK